MIGWVLTALLVLIAIIQNYFPIGKSLVWNYDFPVIYVSSICLFLFFVKLDIGHISCINWLAASSFSVLLFHVAPFAKYQYVNRLVSERFTGITFIIVTALVVVGYYLVAAIVDQIRILVFNKFYSKK